MFAGHEATQYRRASFRAHPPPPLPGSPFEVHLPIPSYCHELTFRTLNPYSKVSVAQVSEQEPSSRSNFVSAQALHTLLALHPPKHDASQHWVALPALHPAVPQASAHSAFGHSSPGASPTTVLTLPLPPTICAHVQVWACGENMQRAQQANKFRVSNAQIIQCLGCKGIQLSTCMTRNTQSHKRMRQCAVSATPFCGYYSWM